MKKIFESVQKKFRDLETLLNRTSIKKDLERPESLAELNDALTNTYVLLNQGFCENLQVCEKCVENRDQLQKLVEMMDQCEEDQALSEEAFSSLQKFRQNIPQILLKMQSVYNENLQNTQA